MNTTLKDYPAFNNMQVFTQALGLVVDHETNSLLYASMVGPNSAVKSTWATICSKNGTLSCQHWFDEEMCGVNPIKQVSTSLPDTHFKHLVALNSQPELLLVVDPHAARLYDCLDIDHATQRATLLEEQMNSVYSRFAAYINTYTQVPILEEWAVAIWNRAQSEGLRELQTFGDCLGAWLVDPHYEWTDLVQELLIAGEITFPQEDCHA